MARQRRRLRNRLSISGGPTAVWMVGASVVVLATILTAGLALVIEDVLPKQDPADRFVSTRIVLVVGTFVLLLFALRTRSVVHRTTGTLFHVQLLDESMKDLRRGALDSAIMRKMSVQSVTRWIDLEHCRRDGVVDVVEVCCEVGAALERSINSDRDDTGYTIVPNVLWPMALAIGGYLPPVHDLAILELPTDGGTAQEVPLVPDVPLRLYVPSVDLDGKTRTGRVGVWLAFGPAAVKFTIDRFAEFGVSTAYPISVEGWIPDKGAPPQLDTAQLAALGPALADHLTRIKTECRGRELVIVAMIPKIAALALGWHLAQAQCRFFHGTHLMYYDEQSKTYVPMRVRASQPLESPQPVRLP